MRIFNEKAFSLVEIVVAVAIASAIFITVFNFGNSIFSFNSNAQKNLSAQTDARRVLKNIVKELRSASPSSLGSYPITLAGTSTITFFANIDTTPIFEYFDSSYAGTSTSLVQPVQITQIRLVRVTLKIEEDPNKSLGPLIVESQVFLRNLKDNL